MPHYSDFILTEADQAVIAGVTDGNGVVNWNSENLGDIKRRVKEFNLKLQANACCYCRRSLHGEFSMVIDVEHILPQCTFKGFVFLNVNLSASCKRCNMKVKRARWDFVWGLSAEDVIHAVEESGTYEIIHPNLDRYSEHLERLHLAVNDGALVKYSVYKDSPKGHKTYNFFRLYELEVDSLDKAQGLDVRDEGGWVGKVQELLGTSKPLIS
ncbi:hypothetical protein [Lysobacter enzymogenes]|uniref:hypothetical protein n=1 Tax=Lysobacter enzymogenes TaxID=69 RepID=UPI001A97AE83|nr:hypothetical protein [Lysobacter enzymogenes]QQP94442.1 hypothetical protein JHW38_14315 [Lysobacter enzymogenes]